MITGVGRDFCTGADLKKFIPELTGDLPKPDGWNKDDAIHAVLHRFPVYKPIVAAVNGTCVAGGFEMLSCTDIRVAVPEARFAVMEPKRGLFAGGGSTVRLPRQMPYALAMELLLTADMVDAERALAMGLLNRVVPADRLMDTAYDYAERIAANAPLAVFATKQSAVEGLALDLDVGLRQRDPAQRPGFRDRGRQGRTTRVRREATAAVAGAADESTCWWRVRRRGSPATAPSSRSTTGSRPRSPSTRSGRSAVPSGWCVR